MHKCNIGIDLGGTKMLVIAKVNDTIVSRKYKTGKTVSFATIQLNLEDFLKKEKIIPIALTVAIPGLVTGSQVTSSDVLPCLNSLSTDDFSTDFPVAFINDIQAALIAEKQQHPTVKNLIVIMIGTGIGMAMIIDGKECHGASGFSGELGYTIINTTTGPTYLDHIASGAGLLKQFNGNAEAFKQSLINQAPTSLKLINNAASIMGQSLSTVISLFNPELVVIGGGTVNYPQYFDQLVHTTESLTLPSLKQNCKIVPTHSLEQTAALGALIHASGLSNRYQITCDNLR